MFQVRESGKPCDPSGFPWVKGCSCWQNSTFYSFRGAVRYAKEWLGKYSLCIPIDWDGSPIEFSCGGSTIEIVTVLGKELSQEEIDRVINSCLIDSAYKETVEKDVLYKVIKHLYEQGEAK